MNTSILKYEELAINAFPAISTELYDGWVLRYSNGHTYRGNCVNPLYASSISPDNKISLCEKKYFSKNLPCVFKMTENAGQYCDSLLECRGYTIQKKADIMATSLLDVSFKNSGAIDAVLVDEQITEQWLDAFVVLNGTVNEPSKSTAKFMLSNIQNKVFCASMMQNNKMVACGLGVLEEGMLGLYDIRVLETYRRQGLGTQICEVIIRRAQKQGAHTAYLQVASSNKPAILLYRNLNFETVYTYWYRVKAYPFHSSSLTASKNLYSQNKTLL